MAEMYTKKNGLLYSADGKTVIGVDETSDKFSGQIPFGCIYIDDEVFSECPYISFSIPDSVEKIGRKLFKDSKNLEMVKLPAYVTELPVQLFAGCSALKKVSMPNVLKGFPKGLFIGCESLEEIPFRAGIKVLSEEVFAGCKKLRSLVIPNTVEVINNRAVANCTALESVVFPSGLVEIADNAFEGCTSIHNIRINGDSEVFYVGDDGSLYMRTGSSEGDKLVVRAYKVNPINVEYFEENVDDKPIEVCDDEYEDIGYDEPIFSAEIGDDNSVENIIEEKIEGDIMSNENDVDSMLADIMGEERERIASSEDVGVSPKESEALSEAISVMEDSAISKGATVSEDELANLFSKNEEEELENQITEDLQNDELDSKSKILVDSAKLNKILKFEPTTDRADSDLFVVAEKSVIGEDGIESFSSHLESCCNKIAKIHDFKRVILLQGLPVENDEFMEFYRHFIGMRNIVLACEAEKPSKLSEYCKVICETSRISLDKKELEEQRRYASVKTDNLIKLVVRDIYE